MYVHVRVRVCMSVRLRVRVRVHVRTGCVRRVCVCVHAYVLCIMLHDFFLRARGHKHTSDARIPTQLCGNIAHVTGSIYGSKRMGQHTHLLELQKG